MGSVKRSIFLWTIALVSAPGCSVFIQNRYAVFGFDGLQTPSAEQARTWSILLLGAVAAVSAALGVTGFWLGRRWYVRRQNKTAVSSCSPSLNANSDLPNPGFERVVTDPNGVKELR